MRLPIRTGAHVRRLPAGNINCRCTAGPANHLECLGQRSINQYISFESPPRHIVSLLRQVAEPNERGKFSVEDNTLLELIEKCCNEIRQTMASACPRNSESHERGNSYFLTSNLTAAGCLRKWYHCTVCGDPLDCRRRTGSARLRSKRCSSRLQRSRNILRESSASRRCWGTGCRKD